MKARSYIIDFLEFIIKADVRHLEENENKHIKFIANLSESFVGWIQHVIEMEKEHTVDKKRETKWLMICMDPLLEDVNKVNIDKNTVGREVALMFNMRAPIDITELFDLVKGESRRSKMLTTYVELTDAMAVALIEESTSTIRIKFNTPLKEVNYFIDLKTKTHEEIVKDRKLSKIKIGATSIMQKTTELLKEYNQI